MTVLAQSSLNSARRSRELADLSPTKPVDLLVIGGGVTGAGVALDAVSRGLSVVLVEKHDLAFGTSRWSSKLVHGGLRYLASGAVGIAHESAVERGILIQRTAPHLVRPFAQVVPLLPSVKKSNAGLVRVGFLAGDALRIAARTKGTVLPRSRRISAEEVVRLAPTVSQEGLRGGLLNWDGQLTDDARLVVGLARTAAAHGAVILTHCEATHVNGAGADLLDTLTGTTHKVAARMVINATGVWAGDVDTSIKLRPSRGTHLVFSQQSFGGLTGGLTVPVPGSTSRFVFALPATDDRVYVGLTDEEAPGPIPDVPTATEDEIDFLLSVINTALATPLTRADMLGTFSGLRPLLESGEGSTADVSRKHAVITSPDGITTIVGGKLTTYRRMAEDALDAALAKSDVKARPCRTKNLALVGAGTPEQLAAVDAPERLVRKYGLEAGQVIAEAQGDASLLEPIAEGTQITMAEMLFAVRHEGAIDEADILDRRTRIGLDPATRERAAAAATQALTQER